jgi:hypothetical protein
MSKDTISVNGGALPKINKATVMHRAWAIFRETYRYPQIKFSAIGRPCFAWALRQAWAEVREASRIEAMAPAVKAERIEVLQSLIARADFIDSGPQWKATTRDHREAIRQLRTA